METKRTGTFKKQTGLAIATTVASILLALVLNPNTATATPGATCTKDADCTATVEKCDLPTSKCILSAPAPVATAPFKATCADVVFSDGTDNYGCVVAAALDWSMPRTVDSVEAKIGKFSPKQLEKYNAALENLVRRECWKTFDYLLSKVKIFGEKDSSDKTGKTYKVAPMTVAELRAFMQEDSQRLDIMAVGRHPRGPKGPQGDAGPIGPQGDPGPAGTCPTCPAPPASGPVK